MHFSLVGVAGAGTEPGWSGGGIPAEHAIRGFHGVTLLLGKAAPTAKVLTGVLGFCPAGEEGALTRYVTGDVLGGHVDLREAGEFPHGRLGRGSVHHVAFRASGDAAQAAMAEKAVGLGLQVTEQKDRNYFRSVYFREPGGVLFEIATDDPGFAVDEPAESLGAALKLPRFLEPRRAELEAKLPPLGVEAA
jgi:glyoxalase family protein